MFKFFTLGFYNLIFWISTPYWAFFLRKRIKRNKEDATRWREKLGTTSLPRPVAGEKIIWVNAVSVGEALAAIPLIERLPELYPEHKNNIRVLLTTSTTTAAKIVEDKLPAYALHQYTVIDHPLFVRRFLAHWQPCAALWVESELWPNMLTQTAQRKVPMALVNARLSPKTVRNWKKGKFIARFLLSHFAICLAQDEENKKALEELGAGLAMVSGNLKYDAKPLPCCEEERARWAAAMAGHQVFLAASTHTGEDEIILNAHRALRKKGKKIKTFIVPRHPARARSVGAMASTSDGGGGKEKIVFYSEASTPTETEEADVYIIDSIGVLGVFYRLADIVFMGGSFVAHGGQNPLEPARLDCALLSGAHVFNFQHIYDFMKKNKGVVFVEPNNLVEVVEDLLNDENKMKGLKQNAGASATQLKGALDKTLAHLRPILKEKENVAS